MGTSGKVNNCGLCSCQLFCKRSYGRPVPVAQKEHISVKLEQEPGLQFLLLLLSIYFLAASKGIGAETRRLAGWLQEWTRIYC